MNSLLFFVLPLRLSAFLNNGFGWRTHPGIRVVHACHHCNDHARVAVGRNRKTSCPVPHHLLIGKQMTGIAVEGNHGTEAPDVSRKWIILKTLVHFRRHVGCRSRARGRVVSALVVPSKEFGDAEVGQLPDGSVAFGIGLAENVVWL